MHRHDTKAVCRGCGKVLNGKAYHLGGSAYGPVTNERAPTNFYGGFVCSRDCDFRASLEQEDSMPGAGRATFLSSSARDSLNLNWREK